jgi:hypothetical protein
MNDIVIGTTRSIRSCGYDEYWLQDQIAESASTLQLGELEVVSRERQQSSGGRLDMLLKDPTDDSMYEVEIMLGDTDETHIVRTIEYWDNEKRKWPKRQHNAVLVAESFTRRFYNVIQLLSHAIPLIAIQVNIVEADGKPILHFSKILDTYEEPEEEGNGPSDIYDEEYWRKRASWTLDTTKALLSVVIPVFGEAQLNFLKYYISITVGGNIYLWLHKRSGGKSLVGFWFNDDLLPEAQKIFDSAGVSYVRKKNSLTVAADQGLIQSKSPVISEAAKLIKRSWEE